MNTNCERGERERKREERWFLEKRLEAEKEKKIYPNLFFLFKNKFNSEEE